MKSKDNATISVIIPTFNRGEMLVRAMRSVCAQSWKDYELIVVDDGSSDGTFELWKKLKNEIQPVQNWIYQWQKNKGVGAARNTGVALAAGQWIAFLDSDDEWLDKKLETQMAQIDENPYLKWVYSDEIWMRGGVRVNAKKAHQKRGGDIFIESVEQCLIGCSSVVILSNFFKKMGGFRENYRVCEDYDLWLRMTLKESVGFLSQPLIIKHGGREDQLSLSTKCMDYYRVCSLDSLLQEGELSQVQRQKVIYHLECKCEILLKGYLKHNNMEHYQEILSIRERWLSHSKKK